MRRVLPVCGCVVVAACSGRGHRRFSSVWYYVLDELPSLMLLSAYTLLLAMWCVRVRAHPVCLLLGAVHAIQHRAAATLARAAFRADVWYCAIDADEVWSRSLAAAACTWGRITPRSPEPPADVHAARGQSHLGREHCALLCDGLGAAAGACLLLLLLTGTWGARQVAYAGQGIVWGLYTTDTSRGAPAVVAAAA